MTRRVGSVFTGTVTVWEPHREFAYAVADMAGKPAAPWAFRADITRTLHGVRGLAEAWPAQPAAQPAASRACPSSSSTLHWS